MAFNMQFQNMQLPKLMPKAKVMRDSLEPQWRESGRQAIPPPRCWQMQTASWASSSGRGRMSNLLLEIAGLDIAEALGFLIGKDQQVALRCAYADFEVVSGVATAARSVAFDTTDTALLIRGHIQLPG